MRRSRLSSYKQKRLIEHFLAGTTARMAAALVGVNKTTAAYYFHRLRELICAAVDDDTPFHGEVEVDESYFNGKFRQECLRQHWFESLHEVRNIVEVWRRDYNHVRPHSSLEYRTPKEVARQHQVAKNKPETKYGACLP